MYLLDSLYILECICSRTDIIVNRIKVLNIKLGASVSNELVCGYQETAIS